METSKVKKSILSKPGNKNLILSDGLYEGRGYGICGEWIDPSINDNSIGFVKIAENFVPLQPPTVKIAENFVTPQPTSLTEECNYDNDYMKEKTTVGDMLYAFNHRSDDW